MEIRKERPKQNKQHTTPQKMSETTTTTPQSILDMTYEQYHGTKGSWAPTIIIISILLIRYLLSKSIKFQRFVSTTKISIKKKLGYRDDAKYQMGVGDGANMNLKRQG